MADTIARLGLVVDATGAQREIRLTREELIKLANGGKEAQTAMAGVTKQVAAVQQPLTQTAVASRAASSGLDRMRGPLTQIAISASGIPGPLGRVASLLGQFAVGSGLTVAALAGIGAIAFAFEKLTASSRRAKDELKAAIDRLTELRTKQGQGLLGQTGADVQTGRSRLGVLGAEISELTARPGFDQIGSSQRARILPLLKQKTDEYTRIALAVQAGELETTRITREAEAERQKIREAAAAKRSAQLQRDMQRANEAAQQELALARGIATMLARRSDSDRQFRALAAGDTSIPGFKLDPFLPMTSITGTTDKIEADKRRQEINAANKQQMFGSMAGSVLGRVGGQGSGIGGSLAGIATSLISGNPFGAAAAGFEGVLGLFGKKTRDNTDALTAMESATRRLSMAFDTMVSNSPSGFFLPRYWRPFAGGSPLTGDPPMLPPPSGTPPVTRTPPPTTPPAMVVNLVVDGKVLTSVVVDTLRRVASTVGGANMPLARAMDYVAAGGLR